MKKLNLTEKKLVFYISLIVALLLNIFKLFTLRENAVMPHYWKFNAYELFFQAAWNFLYCMAVGYITIIYDNKSYKSSLSKIFTFLLVYFLATIIAQIIGVYVQLNIFYDTTPDKIFRALYFGRLFASFVLVAILIRLFRLLNEKKEKQREHEHLQNAYLSAQMELLKEQLNPHFFFNTLSSLSAVVREDAKKAQQYIAHLSRIFHYSLDVKNKALVTVNDELSILQSYIELIKMRFENNVQVKINVDESCLNKSIPHMTLQPLLENAVKHNMASSLHPLIIEIKSNKEAIEVVNNLQPLKQKEPGTGIGLANLNERYKILMKKEIVIKQTDDTFIITLVLSA